MTCRCRVVHDPRPVQWEWICRLALTLEEQSDGAATCKRGTLAASTEPMEPFEGFRNVVRLLGLMETMHQSCFCDPLEPPSGSSVRLIDFWQRPEQQSPLLWTPNSLMEKIPQTFSKICKIWDGSWSRLCCVSISETRAVPLWYWPHPHKHL